MPAIDQSTVESPINKECIKYAARKISDLVDEITKIKKENVDDIFMTNAKFNVGACSMLNLQRLFFFVEYY